MRNFYFALVLFCMASAANAQCPAGRYVNEIFPAVTKDSVMYSTVYNLEMDVYQPAGDTLAARPLIILGHGGSFIWGQGDRTNDLTIDTLCARFARRGYVTVSIDYRTTDIFTMTSTDSTLPIVEVIKAISDGKAAIRYFVKDAATVNNYRIDTNNIFIGGNSAGAVLYMHVGYLDSIGECPSYIIAAMDSNGGFEGNSGNAGYTTRSKAIINLAGALNELSFVGPGDKPSVNCQGNNDNIVPYNCGYPLAGTVHVNLCGLGQLEGAYNANGIYHMSRIFPGDNHVPWASDTAKLNTVDSLVTVFLYNLVCTGVLSVNEVNTNTDVKLYPNPANELLNVSSPDAMKEITLFDEVGRITFQAMEINKENYEVNTSRLSKGIYFVRISFANENNSPVIKRVVVE